MSRSSILERIPGLRAADLWLPGYLRRPRRKGISGEVTDVVLAICDHFEPLHDTDRRGALERVARWQRDYPKRIRQFEDADGCGPRQTFFYPIEQYDEEILDRLSELCRETGAEIEVHLHHDRDTSAGLREKLERGKADLLRHGALSRDSKGNVRFGFVHGNWALAHSHPDGRHCGVLDELAVLEGAGCYADFTMPSAPDRTQTKIVNQIYYAASSGSPKPHDRGTRAQVGRRPAAGELLLVQGPLGLNWRRRKAAVFPRLENGEISRMNPPTVERLRLWIDLDIHVAGQPDWVFIKLHTHGGIPPNMEVFLGDPMERFCHQILDAFRQENGFRIHFVTAREMTNIIHAAEEGHRGDAGRFRDFRYVRELKQSGGGVPPPCG